MEKFNFSGLKAQKLDIKDLPARFATVGGSAYSKGTEIHIEGFAKFPPVRTGGEPFVAAAAVVNGKSSMPVGANTLLGVYFNTQGRQTIENGLQNVALADLVGKTLIVKEVVSVSVTGFNSDGTRSTTERTSNMPVFEIKQ